MHICVTEVDAQTKAPCTSAPQRAGPSIPKIKGLRLDWADKSKWPVELAPNGTYMRPPKYYGTCDDDADVNVPGVLEVLPEEEWRQRKYDEFYARQPYASWIWNAETFVWSSPEPYPDDGRQYVWDELTISWLEVYNA